MKSPHHKTQAKRNSLSINRARHLPTFQQLLNRNRLWLRPQLKHRSGALLPRSLVRRPLGYIPHLDFQNELLAPIRLVEGWLVREEEAISALSNEPVDLRRDGVLCDDGLYGMKEG